jgi:hypothetical protein
MLNVSLTFDQVLGRDLISIIFRVISLGRYYLLNKLTPSEITLISDFQELVIKCRNISLTYKLTSKEIALKNH